MTPLESAQPKEKRRFIKRPFVAVLAGLFLVAAVIVGAIFFFGYDEDNYCGDGYLTDSGFWSYPRYKVTLPAMNLTQDQEVEFELCGLPNEELRFSFTVVDLKRKEKKIATWDAKESLAKQDFELKVFIFDHRQQKVVSTGASIQEWVVAASAIENELWRPDSTFIASSKQTYGLKVKVSGAEESDLVLWVEPTLSGGGNEMP